MALEVGLEVEYLREWDEEGQGEGGGWESAKASL